MAQDKENTKAGFTDVAIGAGSGAAIAAVTSTIYGMTQLKDVKPKEVINALFKDGEGRAKKIADAREPVLKALMESDFAKHFDMTGVNDVKLKAELEAVLKAQTLDTAGTHKSALEGLMKLDYTKAAASAEEQQKLRTGIEAVLKEHAIDPAAQEAVVNALTESRFTAHIKGPHVDVEKLQAGIEAALTKQGFDVKGLKTGLANSRDLVGELVEKLKSEDAAALLKDVQKAVAESINVKGISTEGLNAILSAVNASAKEQKLEPLLEALKKHGGAIVDIDAEKLKATWENARAGVEGLIKDHVVQLVETGQGMADSVTGTIKSKVPTSEEFAKLVKEAAGSVKGPQDVATAAKAIAGKMGKVTEFAQVVPDIAKAATDATSFPGKSMEERLKFLTRNPKDIIGDLKGVVNKAFADNKVDLKGEARGFAEAADDAARKLIGGTKYKYAKAYEKPFVAFDAMPIKGKVALGAAVIGTTAIGSMLAANRHGSHAEAVQNAAGSQSAQVGG